MLKSDPTYYETAYVAREERTWPDGSPKRSAFGDNFAVMVGRGVRDFALNIIPGLVNDLVKSEGLELDDIDLMVFHQANYHLIHKLLDMLGIPPEKTITNVERNGNTSGAGVPLALRDAIDAGKLRPGSVVALVSFGAGMSYGGTVVRWCGADEFRCRP